MTGKGDGTGNRGSATTLAMKAFEAALRGATTEGLRDLHEAIQIGEMALDEGRAGLVRGHWGSLGRSKRDSQTGYLAADSQSQTADTRRRVIKILNNRSELPRSACPLNALFIREARARGGDLQNVVRLATVRMGKEGFCPPDFYKAWDRGRIRPQALKELIEKHMTDRLNSELGR